MRDRWGRANTALTLSVDELAMLMQPAFPGQTVVAAEPASGGLANTNIRITLTDRDAPLLVRLYQRDGTQAGKEVALNRLVAGRVPVPRFHFHADSNPVTGHAYVVMDWVAAERLEAVAGRLSAAAVGQLGRSVGTAVAGIHAHVFDRMGELDADLSIVEPYLPGRAGFVGFLRAFLTEGRGGERLGADLTRGVMAFANTAGRALDAWDGPPCLAHCDFGGSNILVRQDAPGWTVAAVLDWEFAVSATSFIDLGNLLRPPVGDMPGFAAAVAGGYREAGGRLPENWHWLSRVTDLLAWAEFLSRPSASARLIEDARTAIADTIAACA